MPFTCVILTNENEVCGEKFPLISDLREHVAQRHLNLNIFECVGCQENFVTINKMISHIAQCELKTRDIAIKKEIFNNSDDIQTHAFLEDSVMRSVYNAINSAYSRGVENGDCVDNEAPSSSSLQNDDESSLLRICRTPSRKRKNSFREGISPIETPLSGEMENTKEQETEHLHSEPPETQVQSAQPHVISRPLETQGSFHLLLMSTSGIQVFNILLPKAAQNREAENSSISNENKETSPQETQEVQSTLQQNANETNSCIAAPSKSCPNDPSVSRTVSSVCLPALPTTLNLKFSYLLEARGIREVISWCMKEGLMRSQYQCNICKQPMKLTKQDDCIDEFSWVCDVKEDEDHCIKRSIRKGSVFEGSKLSICNILRLSFLWVCGADPDLVKNELSITSCNTIMKWRRLFREICLGACVRNKQKVGGPGIVVEIDEFKFIRRKFRKELPSLHRISKKIKGRWVFIGIERGTRKYFFKVVRNRGSEALLGVLREFILSGTTVASDCWKRYDCLLDSGYVNLATICNLNLVDLEKGAHTNTVDGLWGLVKQDFRNRPFSRNSICLESIAEHMWRNKYKNQIDEIFPSFLASIKAVYYFSVAKEENNELIEPIAAPEE